MYLKDLKPYAYVPRVVSLGLFHHRMSQTLSQIELRKVKAVNPSVKRLPRNQQHTRFLVQKVQSLLPEITASYEGKPECEEEILAWLFTLDGCFILETLRLLSDESRWNPNPDCQFDIFTDLLMLENQVPMIVLIQLLEMEENLTEETARIQLLRMICDGIIALAHPFSYSMQRKTGEPLIEHKQREAKLREDLKSKYRNLKEYNHILGFFHDFIVNESETNHGEEQTQDVNITVPEGRHHSHFDGSNPRRTLHDRRKESDNGILRASATELNNKEMKFKAYEGVLSTMELCFDKKKETLFLPVIWVSDATEMIFRNLMAVDVCQEKELIVISEYVFLMNSLIESDKDVALLRKKGVIQSSIGSDKAATDLFNSLCKRINFTLADEDKFMKLKSDVNSWYRSRTVVKFMRWVETHRKLVQFAAMGGCSCFGKCSALIWANN
ncbi:hypothetical protein SUGI_1092560 [Cryptomeria japonica]|uniref:UPF0481 protein At3g47200-like n=1 Tax=Cryptomeria japonica TaxID=3369 RepID=UPI002414BCDC|nr:UPF0481 protein At3g47200-like [Cryptomeria japonica]GLJ51397.1 hypothetical protein SUGI_1092560 [Cryptomeria japonica]